MATLPYTQRARGPPPLRDCHDVVTFPVAWNRATSHQIREYDLPTDPAKESSHSAGWGNRRACQLEALEPNVLARILSDAIEDYIDSDTLRADRQAEEQERRQIARALPAPGT
jgi:hypothetical protein